MEVSRRNESNQARIDALEARLAALEGPPPEDISDVLGPPLPDGEKIKRFRQLFAERKALLQRIDEEVDALIEVCTAERVSRVEIVTLGLEGVDKFQREQLRSDTRVITAILTRLARHGVGHRLVSGDVPLVVEVAKTHDVILQQLEGLSK